jgi:hypothetical protein
VTIVAEPVTAEPPSSAAGRHRVRTAVTLMAALLAAGALLIGGRHEKRPPVASQRMSIGQAWPRAAQAELPNLLVTPKLFLNATTAVGTVPTRDGTFLRLAVETVDGRQRELHRLPADVNPQFENVTAAGDELIWTEATDRRRLQLWTANLRTGGPARRLTADTGDALFFGTRYDLVVAGGRVYWAAAPDSDRARATQIRSVALTGGPVRVREEPGEWALTAWPWLTDNPAGPSSTVRLRNMDSGRDVQVATSGVESSTCTPTWCRVLVMAGDRLARIDVMHPDGSGRRRVAGSGAQAAVADVAVLNRFEILAEPHPDSDLTGTASLLVYDIGTGRTVTVTAAAAGAFTGIGILWWSTGDPDNLVWHTLDLRTA